MTKKEMFAIAEKYGMTLKTHPVTGETKTYTVMTDNLTPELDKRVDSGNFERPAVDRMLIADQYLYTIHIPSGWIKLYA